MKKNHYSGSCLCGAVRYEVNGEFDHFYLCHCDYCRKDTGSAHAANLLSKTARLNWLNGEAAVKTFTLAATRHSKSFCTHCGSALPSLQLDGALLVVPAGSLDDKLSIRPQAHLFTRSRADWDADLDGIPKFDSFPA